MRLEQRRCGKCSWELPGGHVHGESGRRLLPLAYREEAEVAGAHAPSCSRKDVPTATRDAHLDECICEKKRKMRFMIKNH